MQQRITRNRSRAAKIEEVVTKVGVTTRSQRRALGDLTNQSSLVEVVGKDQKAADEPKKTHRRATKRKAPEPCTQDSMDIPRESPDKQAKKEDPRISMSSDIQMLEIEDDPWSGYLKCDIDTKNDPQHVIEYLYDIMDHLKNTEAQRMANPDYMTNQPDITDRMRAILVDWLVEVHLKFRLKPETLYLTINYIDRFLSSDREVKRSRLQLVGCTAMLLASKYEEIYAPEVRDFVYISDNAYSRQAILQMEDVMASVLKWDFTVPTMYNFAERYLKVSGNEERVNMTTNYLMEICLVNLSMLKYRPSMCASACVYLARKIIEKSRWSDEMIKETGYTSLELRRCVEELYGLLVSPSPRHKAVKKKYSSSKFGKVARLQVVE